MLFKCKLQKGLKYKQSYNNYFLFCFTNLIKTPACFMKDSHRSIVDTIFTNKLSLLFNVTHFISGISELDKYNIICIKEGPYLKNVWPIANTLLYKKDILRQNVIILSHNDQIISDQTYIVGTLNEFYVNVAHDLSIELIRIQTIIAHIPVDFSPVTQ